MTITVLTLISVVSLGQHSFSEAWYLEMMLGKPQEALRKYQYIYKDKDSPLSVRRKAALRAAECAEKLGDLQKAVEIYRWFELEQDSEDPLTRKALARLSVLSSSGNFEPGPPSFPTPLPTHLKEIAERRRRAFELVWSERQKQRRLNRSIAGVEPRLRRIGVELSWPTSRDELTVDPRSFAVEKGPVDAFLKSLPLDARDEEHLRSYLSHRLFVSGLKSLRAFELRRALIVFQIQQEVSTEPSPEVAELSQTLKRILAYAEELSSAAGKRLAEEYDANRGEALSLFERAVEEAQRQARDQDADKALAGLIEVERQKDWAPVGIVREGRIPTVVAHSLIPTGEVLAPGVYEEIEALEKENRRTATQIAFTLEELLETWPLPWQDSTPVLEERDVMFPRLKRQIEEDIMDIESDQKGEIKESFLRETLLLLKWFNELDPSERYRGLINSKLKP